jgi:hypothetical protein
LVISALGSRGQDGAAVDLGESEFVELEVGNISIGAVDMCEVKAEAVGEVDGVPDKVISSIQATFVGRGGAQAARPEGVSMPFQQEFVNCGFTGATSATVQVWNGSTLVDEVTGVTGTVAELGQMPARQTWTPLRKHNEGASPLTSTYVSIDQEFHEPIEITITGSTPVVGNRLVVIPEGDLPDIGIVSRLDVTGADVDSIIIPTERLGLFDLPHEALGQATLAASAGTLTVANLGSSGNDGVSVHWEDDPDATCPTCPQAFNAHWLDLDPEGALPVNATMSVSAVGSVGGVADQLIGTGYARKTSGGSWVLGADFDAIGTTTQTIEVYDGAALVAQVTGHTGHDAVLAGGPPGDWHWKNESDGPLLINHPEGCTGTFDVPVPIEIVGLLDPVKGDAVKMIPEDHTLESAYFSEIVFRTADIPSFTLDAENTGEIIVGVGDPATLPRPLHLAVGPVTPNPFSPHMTLRFVTPADGAVAAAVYDVAGRRVRTLLRSSKSSAGEYVLTWDGSDDGGRAVAAGVYWFRVRAGSETRVVRGSLVR